MTRSVLVKTLEPLLSLNPGLLEERFKAREVFQGIRVEPPFALRLDGVGWGRRLRGAYEWPRDPRVHAALVSATVRLLDAINACCGLVVSDEADIVVVAEPPYAGRVEKLVSISAGLVSGAVSASLGRVLYTDSRIVKLLGRGDAEAYLLYRMRVGLNNYVASLYHGLVAPESRGATPGLDSMLEKLLAARLPDNVWEPWRLLGTCIARTGSIRRVEGGARAKRRRIIAIDASPSLCIKAVREAFSPG